VTKRKRSVRMDTYESIEESHISNLKKISVIVWIIILICGCCMVIYAACFYSPRKPPTETPQPQQDIETGQRRKVLMFKDIKKEEGEGFCPICLEEYEDDHEIRRLKKCGHVFHRFCIDSWLTRHRSCPSCRRSVDLICNKRKRSVRMDTFDKVNLWILVIGWVIIIIYAFCKSCNSPTESPAETPQPQQDIETGQRRNSRKVLMFKDIKEEEEEGEGEGEGEGCGKRFCPICLEEYEDDHEIRRLKECGHVFHRFCIRSWLKRDRRCPICRRSVDLISDFLVCAS
ncbi:unnamed protein product, partial [Thlaspi arvense]